MKPVLPVFGVRPRPILPTPFRAAPDGKNGWFVNHDSDRVGYASPVVIAEPAGPWYGKRAWQKAARYEPNGEVRGAERLALAHICHCRPSEIRFEVAS